MTYTGLFTQEEALECERSGYRGGWSVIMPSTGFQVDSVQNFWGPSAHGCVPRTGALLPMACAPKDGREILVFEAAGASVVTWDKLAITGNGDRGGWMLSDTSGARPDSDFDGWQPIVRRVDE